MDINHKIITKNAQETAAFGEKIARDLTGREVGPRIFCLYGDLGSGKTTFAQGFAKGLGITSRLLSPTFIIVRRYDIPSSEKLFYHIDLYRLKNTEEMDELGLSEIFSDPAAVVVIEWAEKLGELMPKERIDVHFTVLPNEKHKIVIK